MLWLQCFTWIRHWIYWNCKGLRRIRPTRWVIYFKCSHRAFLILPRILKSSLADLCWSLQRLATIRCVLQKLARFGRSCNNMQDFAKLRWALLKFAKLGNNLLRLALFGIDLPDYAEILVLDPPVSEREFWTVSLVRIFVMCEVFCLAINIHKLGTNKFLFETGFTYTKHHASLAYTRLA